MNHAEQLANNSSVEFPVTADAVMASLASDKTHASLRASFYPLFNAISAPYRFSASEAVKHQFLHSCCHMLAEAMVYLFHDMEGVSVNYIHLSWGSLNHSCVEVIKDGESFYIDAEGIFPDVASVWSRYQCPHSPYIDRLSGEAIVDNGNNARVRSRSESTPTWEALNAVAHDVGIDDVCELEDAFMLMVIASLLNA